MIKMIAMDFDWTLINHTGGRQTVEPKLMEWLYRFIENGGHAGIVSGRRLNEMRELMGWLGYKWGEPFPTYVISRESFIYSVNKGKEAPQNPWNEISAEKINILMRQISYYAGEWLRNLEKEGLCVINWFVQSDFSFEVSLKDNQQADRAIELLNKYIAQTGIEGAYVHRNQNSATVISNDCGKGNSLYAAAMERNILPGEVLAIGDSFNDLSMIAGCKGFVGGTVENAEQALKKAVLDKGGYIGKGIASEGVLDILIQLSEKGEL